MAGLLEDHIPEPFIPDPEMVVLKAHTEVSLPAFALSTPVKINLTVSSMLHAPLV